MIQNDDEVGEVWSWTDGNEMEPDEISSIPSPIHMKVVFYRGYQGPPGEMRDVGSSVMSRRLADALTGAGVDNITFYPVSLLHEESGQVYDYVAFHLVGKVAAADLESSKISTFDGRIDGTAGIHKLVVDESAPKGMLMFRLAENTGTILVHESVREYIEKQGIDTLDFMKPEEYVQL
jgi:hypothetical protein